MANRSPIQPRLNCDAPRVLVGRLVHGEKFFNNVLVSADCHGDITIESFSCETCSTPYINRGRLDVNMIYDLDNPNVAYRLVFSSSNA